jgi:hypothetical protein
MTASEYTPCEGDSADGELRRKEILRFLEEQRSLLHDLVRHTGDQPVERVPNAMRDLRDRADLLADLIEKDLEE